jgi:hypothetical protein
VPLTGGIDDEVHLMRVGRIFTLLWAVVLVGGAMLFQLCSRARPSS